MRKQQWKISNNNHAAAIKTMYKHLKVRVQSEMRHAYWSYTERVVLLLVDNDKPCKSFWSFVRCNWIAKMEIALLKSPDTGDQVGDAIDKGTILNRQFQQAFVFETPLSDDHSKPQTRPNRHHFYRKWHTVPLRWIGSQQSQWPR